ncbi:hypothetical protein C8F04DRAFT_1179550 [Mycena alexandri]|uniref:Uncharacterized protein n=1 Tax=Mycena alexandri TaxID=1745969 RepID=A0AAD6T481_9AGAR|nr:hypothetical protein C8F04DRAFT_1179550 [Mycena alexandri]
MAALHSRLLFSNQTGFRPASQNAPFPAAPPTRTPQYNTKQTRDERKVESLIRDKGTSQFPSVVMSAPAQTGPSSAQQGTSSSAESLGLNLNNPLVTRKLEEIVRAMMKGSAPKPSTRGRKPGKKAQFDKAVQEQRSQLTEEEHGRWLSIIREFFRLNTGFNRARDFCSYTPATDEEKLRCQAGHIRPEVTSKLYFGEGWATCLWNQTWIEKSGARLEEQRNKDRGKGGGNSTNRAAEKTIEEAVARGDKQVEKRRVDSLNYSRKTTKYNKRQRQLKTLLQIAVAKKDRPAMEAWQYAGRVVTELGPGGMSSEEDVIHQMNIGKLIKPVKMNEISLCEWRAKKATDVLILADEHGAATVKGSGPAGRERIRGQTMSDSFPPVGLARALYDADWLATQKTFDPDFEEELNIAEKDFTLRDIEMAE